MPSRSTSSAETAGTRFDPADAPCIRRILVVVDPTSETQPAIDKAAKLAAILGSALELYICDIRPAPPLSALQAGKAAEFRELRRRELLDQLERYAEPLRARGLTVSKHCEWHTPLEQGIGYHVLRTRPDLVVKQTHRHDSIVRDQRAPTDWSLIAQLPAPLLLVREEPWAEAPAIAVSVDPCHVAERPESLDQALIALGCLFTNCLGGNLEAWHVLESPPHLPGEPATPIDVARAAGAAREAVERVVTAASNLPKAIPTHYLKGAVAGALAENASQRKPDVLMLGGAARPRWAHSLASGTAAQLLEHLNCDLLVVKPRGFVSPLLVHEA